AEIECLRKLRSVAPKNATLYVTLEPCSTSGRTPPCTKTIIAAGITHVVVGATDPNPLHAGRGIKQLRAAGVQVRDGILAFECALLNEGYNKWIQTRQPFVIAKCGMSLDGRLTRPPTEPRWLTSPAARRHAHRLRAHADAILIGAETLRQDNPKLTVRGGGEAKQPWRVVLSRSGRLPRDAKLFTDRFADRTLVYRKKSLAFVLEDMGRKEITSVLIEGGGDVLGQALETRLIDKLQIYLAPLFTGGSVVAFSGRGAGATDEALPLTDMSYQRLDGDICITGYPVRRDKEWAE
ncbi:MAG: bifunctional diaminohydroxyphosphoribosylaminopyrimidine deaminase/5-amino-6-(5-phosphoribosylamino)uracil reductase RibD, partial [Verrucomicrobiota bacterium]|nr:bifunctional diaminohydroxyphosphoribosylaminopyrimidine deaminase/5-amino-6-(5-phosphoribosylamino)uracil reductase RibD [Verrucomicrobiota bacterium]